MENKKSTTEYRVISEYYLHFCKTAFQFINVVDSKTTFNSDGQPIDGFGTILRIVSSNETTSTSLDLWDVGKRDCEELINFFKDNPYKQ